MKVLGITGGIGSGKSVVSRILTSVGVPTFDCDRQAQFAYTDPLLRPSLVSLLGADCFLPSGTAPDKPRIAQRVFEDHNLLQQLEALIHPYVRGQFEDWKHRKTSPWVAIESAILLEKGWDDLCDAVWYVDCPIEIRANRVMARNQASREQALQRIRLQESQKVRTSCRPLIMIINDNHRPVLPQIEQAAREINLPIYNFITI